MKPILKLAGRLLILLGCLCSVALGAMWLNSQDGVDFRNGVGAILFGMGLGAALITLFEEWGVL